MQVVVSQAWTLDAFDHARAYIAKSEAFAEFLSAQPGFVTRMLLRGVDDATHFTNVRVFESVAHYEAITEIPAYRDHIADLSRHVDVERYAGGYPREYMDLVVATGQLPTEG